VLQVLQERWDPTFSEHSSDFGRAVRPPGCSPGTALRRRWLQRSG
jgi:hypothetical protein